MSANRIYSNTARIFQLILQEHGDPRLLFVLWGNNSHRVKMDSAGCKVWVLLGIALPRRSGDTHSPLLMISWCLRIFLFWKNSGVFLLIQTLCQPGSLQRLHTHILAPVLVNHSRCQQSQSKCIKDNYLVDDTTLCPLTVINFSCISTRLVAEACENTVCKH